MTWQEIPDEEWAEALAAAEAAKERWSRSGYTDRNWNEHRHLLGYLGERYVADRLDLPWDPGRLGRGADGGVDFAGTDVKTYGHTARELQRGVHASTWATWYTVILVDLGSHRRRVAGHTHRSELQAAPIRDYGHGPTHCLPIAELEPGLPPHLVIAAYRRRS